MSPLSLKIGTLSVGNDQPFVLFGGINVMESAALVAEAAQAYHDVCAKLGIGLVFKASFDKANRSSIHSFRGPGLAKGMDLMAQVKEKYGFPVITDVHEPAQAAPVAEVCDVLQIPAFLARQTDLVTAVARTGKVINVKKPQFIAPQEMGHILKKCHEAGNHQVMICERGSCFGYNNLVVDMLGLAVMKETGHPVIFDVTHALQQPGGLATGAGGRRQYVSPLARSGMAVGLAGLFLEAHPDPDQARCDGPCALKLSMLEPFLAQLKQLDQMVKAFDAIDTK